MSELERMFDDKLKEIKAAKDEEEKKEKEFIREENKHWQRIDKKYETIRHNTLDFLGKKISTDEKARRKFSEIIVEKGYCTLTIKKGDVRGSGEYFKLHISTRDRTKFEMILWVKDYLEYGEETISYKKIFDETSDVLSEIARFLADKYES